VNCFTSDAARDQFWAGTSIPFTKDASKAYQRKVTELARRCGQVSGDLLDHISTADTTRDLDALRGMVGDDLLTYVGLSYGTEIGQTYINLFPKRIRAMVLDGIVDPVLYTKNAETRVASQGAAFDAVFSTFLDLCESAGAGHCALAGHGETVAQRVARVIDTAKRSSIPAPHSDPPGALDYADFILGAYNPLRTRAEWAGFAADLNAAAEGDASKLEDAARPSPVPGWFRGRDHLVCDLVPRRFRPQTLPVLAQCHPEVHRVEHVLRTAAGLVAVGTVRVELAGAEHRSV
jgi:pimeloyl-ACP methyl ester carboxylesterase